MQIVWVQSVIQKLIKKMEQIDTLLADSPAYSIILQKLHYLPSLNKPTLRLSILQKLMA